MSARVVVSGLGLVVALAASGCASSGGAAGRSAGSGGRSGGGSATAPIVPGVPARVAAADADNGRTVVVARGGVVSVSLTSTYWRFAAVAAPLQRASVTAHFAHGHYPPGAGAGTLVGTFRAVAPGTATISATRTTCGEALRCPPSASTYRLTVVVR